MFFNTPYFMIFIIGIINQKNYPIYFNDIILMLLNVSIIIIQI